MLLLNLLLLAICSNAQTFLTADEVAAQENAVIISRGKKSQSRTLFSIRPSDTPEKCDKDSLKCVDDKILFCGPDGEDQFRQCLIEGQDAYCNCERNGCSATRPTDCPVPLAPCYQPGLKMPVPGNCSRFTYCESDLTETTFQCPPNFVYDPTSQRCTTNGVCSKVECPASQSGPIFVQFPQSPEYYIFCRGSVYDRVSKCSHEGYVAEKTSCQYKCVQEGMFQDPDPLNCENGIFYWCKKSPDGNLNKQKLKCLDGKVFDNTFKICTSTAQCIGDVRNDTQIPDNE